MRNKFFFILAVACFFISGAQVVNADFPTYTIDQAPLTPPSFDDYTIIPVTSIDQLTDTTTGLPGNNDKIVYELQSDLQLASQIIILNNKAINLNGHTLTATSAGSLLIEQTNTSTKNFGLFGGTITGGPTAKTIGKEDSTNTAFLNIPVKYAKKGQDTVRNVMIENITYNSNSTGGSFVSGLATNVYSLGTVNVSTYCVNIRAANMTFLGDFTGNSFGNAWQNEYGTGSGGLNLTFGGTLGTDFRYSYINKHNYGSETMSQTNGDRRMYVAKDSHVTLTNTNNQNLAYANNIGNFATLNVDGSLVCNAVGTSLRSTAAYNTGENYDSNAGTFNGMANITVNKDSIFEITSTSTTASYGAIYTYRTNLYIDDPKSFDIRYLGKGNFMYSQWYESSMYIHDQNIGVWTKEQKGIGNPTNTWFNVDWMSVIGFKDSSSGTVTSSNSDLTKNFQVADYSRISNDVSIPALIPDDTQIGNGETSFSGSTEYQYNDGTTIPNNIVSGATVTLQIGSKSYTTTTDSEGKWTFNDIDLSSIKVGTVGTVNLTDTDQRTAEPVTVTVKDTIPPTVTTQVLKVKAGTANGLDDPKAGIKSASDETTASSKLIYAYKTSQADRDEMLKTAGVYTVAVNVSDEAGNTTTASVPVIVYEGTTIPSNGFVVGTAFEVDYATWKSASDDDKRNMVISKGAVKGYTVTNTTVTEVSDDSLNVSIPSTTWEPNNTYDVTVTVGNYTKTIEITLVPSTVKMTVKQVYAGTDTAIYSDLANKTTVDNTKTTEVEIGDNIKDVVNQLITDKSISLNYTGYDTQTVDNYKIYQNGSEVSQTPTTVPDADFTVVYEYTGQLKFGDEVATNLDFGTVEISGSSSATPLTDTSDQKISIINTLQNKNWTLKAAIPDGITSNQNNVFLGSLIYKNGSSNEQVIGSSATTIENQSDDSLLNELDLKNGADGLYLQQNGGNLKGSYSGRVIWTLEDAP